MYLRALRKSMNLRDASEKDLRIFFLTQVPFMQDELLDVIRNNFLCGKANIYKT